MKTDKPIFLSKLLYFLSMCGIVILGFFLPQFFYTLESLQALNGALIIMCAFIGSWHMKALGRAWGWGLFAATGLGALIILFIPPKYIKPAKNSFDSRPPPPKTKKQYAPKNNNIQCDKYSNGDHVLKNDRSTQEPARNSSNSVDNFPIVKKLFEYSGSAKDAWSKLEGFPGEYRLEFLESLQSDPQKNVSELLDDLKKKRAAELAPFDDKETNELYRMAMGISPAAASEFKKTVELFGSNIKPFEVLEKIKVTAEERQNAKSPKALRALRMASLLSTTKDISRELSGTGYSLEFGAVPGVGWFVLPDGSKTQYTGLSELKSICSVEWAQLHQSSEGFIS